MGKIYERKTNRQGWSRESMTAAMTQVKEGAAVNAMAKKYNLPEATLRRYAKKYSENALPTSAGRFKPTFTEEQLMKLKQYVHDLDKRAFGVTSEQFSRIAFDYAESLNIPHHFNKEKKKVGKDFIHSFMAKFKFSFRKPEATSAARLSAFNKPNVEAFFDLYQGILATTNYEPHQIYNVDETGCSTVPTKTPTVLSPTGQRRVIKVSSAERGTNVSVACCFSAVGNYVPPFFIFPRVRMQPHFLNNAPPGSSGVCNESGWMNADAFVKWLEHFIKNVRPSQENPILLFMDNHSSHVTLNAVNLCRENHINVIGFPPHTSHRMQPLDVAFYGPFKTAYSRACNDYLTQNPGQIVNIKDIAGLFSIAYSRVATITNAAQGFRATGLVPINSQIFSDFDFEPSMTTENPHNAAEIYANHPNEAEPPLLTHNIELVQISSAAEVNVAGSSHELAHGNSADVNRGIAGPSYKSPFGLPPLPRAAPKQRRQKKKLPSLHITGTPVKNALEVRKADNEAKEQRKIQNQKKKAENKIKKAERSEAHKSHRHKSIYVSNNEESSDSSISVNYVESDDDNDTDVIVEHDLCLVCNDSGKRETWFECSICQKWAHAACSGLTLAEAKRKSYVCDFC